MLLIWALTVFSWNPAWADPIVSIQSVQIKPFRDALEGFKSVCGYEVKQIILSEMDRGTTVFDQIQKETPQLILALGRDALEKAKMIPNIPIIYLLVLNPDIFETNKLRITGVDMLIPPEKQLAIFQTVLPDMRNIGVLFDPNRTGEFILSGKKAAKERGLNLITSPIEIQKNGPSLVMNMRGKIDAYWMIPDQTVNTSETNESILMFSITHKIPIFTFSQKYLKIGAFMAITFDTTDMGRQAGEIAERIFTGTSIQSIPPKAPRKINARINKKILQKLGIKSNSREWEKNIQEYESGKIIFHQE